MASLMNQSKKITLVENLKIAQSFRTRAQGLIGKKSMTSNEGMWFPKSNWIHTFFMSMPIDVIYLDKKMTVKKLETNLRPWRFAAPVFSANSVVEVAAGFIVNSDLQLGDILYVGD